LPPQDVAATPSDPAPQSAPSDSALAHLLALWPTLPEPVRTALLALAEAARSRG